MAKALTLAHSAASGDPNPPKERMGRNLISHASENKGDFVANRLVLPVQCCIMHGMYRAEVEPMPSNPPDRLPRSGLWKVCIYEGERFVRTDKENMIISVAEKLAEEFNYQFGHKKKARGT